MLAICRTQAAYMGGPDTLSAQSHGRCDQGEMASYRSIHVTGPEWADVLCTGSPGEACAASPDRARLLSDQTIISIRALQDAWIVFLRQWAWQWFYTFTFRESVHPESADKRFRLLISMVNRELYGLRWHKKGFGVQWVRALEFQKRGVIHYHALVAGVEDKPRHDNDLLSQRLPSLLQGLNSHVRNQTFVEKVRFPLHPYVPLSPTSRGSFPPSP
jgi:hypothetical protein